MQKIEYVDTLKIKPYDKNPRNNEDAVQYVMNSISEFGFKNPILVDKDYVIIAGHTRLKAALRLGIEHVPVIVCTDLTDEQVRAYRIADNKVSEVATWNIELLDAELMEITDIDMSLFGFDPSSESVDAEDDTYDAPLPPNPVSKLGDIWAIGDHRVLCGDATNESDIIKLLDGGRADIMFTSPPYALGKSIAIHDNIHTDNGKSSLYIDDGAEHNIFEWYELMVKSTELALKYTDGVMINLQMLANNKRHMIKWLNDYADKFIDVMIWDKGIRAPALACNVMNSDFEFVFMFGAENSTRAIPHADFRGTMHNIVKIDVGHNEFSDVHAAVFPVALPSHILNVCSKATSVLDIFAGTGTTMIAAEQLGRKSYLMDLEPAYVDLIVDRYIKFKEGNASDVFLIRNGRKIPYDEVTRE